MGGTPTIPAPPDPTDANLKSTTGDKVGGFLGAISKGGALGSISDAFGRAHEKRLAEAKMYHDVMVEKMAHPAYSDPSDPDYQKTQDAYNAAEKEYLKRAPDPETKKQMQMRSAIAKHHVSSQSGITPPPTPGAQQPTAAATPAPSAGGSALPPPPATGAGASSPSSSSSPSPPVDMTKMMAGIPSEMQGDADKRTIKMEAEKQKLVTAGKIEEDKAKGAGKKAKHLQHVPVFNPKTGQTEPGSYDPDSGEYLDQQGNIIEDAQLAAKQFTYMGPNAKPLIGWAIGDTLYDQEMKPLPLGTEKFVAWMAPRTTTSEGFRSEVQPDGSTKLIPVETSSTTVRGAGGGGAPSGAGKTDAKESTSPIVTKPSAPKVTGAGTTVGGKVPAGVAKAYEAYNGSQERMAVMQDALPRALKGDQQAMLNLLANHVGMTMGLQKGGRITEGIYSEAAASSPVIAKFEAKFDKDGNFSLDPRDYRGGITLTPDQMRQMVDLAKVRVTQDEASWKREIGSAKQGYGMTPPPKPKQSKTSGPKVIKYDAQGNRL